MKVELRPLRKEDLNENYLRWVNDPEVTKYMEPGRFPVTMENLFEYYERMTNSEHDLIFAIWADGNHIGNITLNGINWIHRTAEVALMIGEKKYWSKGIGTKAIELISNHAFEKLNLYKLTAGTYSDNLASQKAFLRAGYIEEAVIPSLYQSLGGGRVGRVIFGRVS